MTEIDKRLAWITARRQAFGTADAAAVGASPQSLSRRAKAGRLERLYRGAYGAAGVPATYDRALQAAAVALGPRAVVSYRSAAAVWGLKGVAPKLPEFTVPYNSTRTRAGILIHSSDALGGPDVVLLTTGMAITSPAKTVLDLGSVMRFDLYESMIHDALSREIVRYDHLTDVHDRLGGKGRRGSAALGRFLREYPPDGPDLQSELELRFWRLVKRERLPVPVAQHPVVVRGATYRLDFAYLPTLGIELLGMAWHAGWNAVRRDVKRRRALTSAGFTVLEFTWDEVVRQRRMVADEVLASLARLSLAS